jgi:hypothetical protein
LLIKEAALPTGTMANVTVQLTDETELRLREQANRCGQTLEHYLRDLAEKEAAETSPAADMLDQGMNWLTSRADADVQSARERILGNSPRPRDLPAGKTVLDMVEGKWPGSETDMEIQDALERLS